MAFLAWISTRVVTPSFYHMRKFLIWVYYIYPLSIRGKVTETHNYLNELFYFKCK